MKHRFRRALLALVIGTVAAVVPAGAAFAGEWSATRTSGCTSAISLRAGGGWGNVNLHYNANRLTTRKYAINWSHAWADNFWTCQGDFQVSPYKTVVTVEFNFDGTNLSCSEGFSVSLPPGASYNYGCTSTGFTQTISYSATCMWSYSCSVDLGYTEFLFSYGAYVYNYVNTKSSVTVTNTNGYPYSWGTPLV